MPRHMVAVCTLGRSETLAACLEALLADMAHGVLLVVDNGPADGSAALCALARHVLARRGPGGVALRLVRAPLPGLARARNRAVRAAQRLGVDIISFVDDDATVRPGWQAQALAPFAHAAVAVVGGPIVTVLPRPVPRWWSEAINRFYSTADTAHLTGPCAPIWPAGGNISYRMAAVGRHPFDPDFGWAGRGALALAGEETTLNLRLAAMGWTAWFNPGATVDHHVPVERMRVRWLLRRAAAFGRTAAVFERRVERRASRQVRRRYRRLLGRSALRLALAVLLWRWSAAALAAADLVLAMAALGTERRGAGCPERGRGRSGVGHAETRGVADHGA